MPDPTPTGAEIQETVTQDQDDAADAKKFTQKELELLLDKRLKRERTKWEKDLATARDEAVSMFREEHGLDDERLQKLGEGQGEDAAIKSELRKLKTESTRWKNQHDQQSEIVKRQHEVIRQSKVVDVLLREAAGRFVDPQDAVDKLAPRFKYDPETMDVYIADDKGEPSATTVRELVDSLLASKPHLAVPTGVPGTGSRVSTPAAASAPSSSAKSQAERVAMLRGALAPE